MNEQILVLFSRYGTPALFVIVAVAAIGVPLPVTLLLIITGSMVAQGVLDPWAAIAVASAGSILGDLAGFIIGRWGGNALVTRYKRLLGSAEKLRQLEARADGWGAAGIFFSRWLVTPLGPWINLASGAGGYSWRRFAIWDVIGETFGAVLFIELGRIFSDRVQEVGSALGDLDWALVGLVMAFWLGRLMLSAARRT